MTAHAPLPPSGAEQWAHCTGSARAQASRPDVETPQSREGTAAHWVMEMALLLARSLARMGAPVPEIKCDDWVGETAPNGVVIDGKMAEGAQVIVDDVLEVARRFDLISELVIEGRVAMPEIHRDNWGTLDVGLYVPSVSCLFLWDYKHGHREVNPVENFQFSDYALGQRNHYGLNGQDEQRITFVARLVQPFSYSDRGPVREWRTPLSQLRPIWNHLHNKAHEAENNPTFTAGLWCRDCKALNDCATARRYNYRMIDCVNEAPELDSMDGPSKAAEREILRDGLAVMRARIEALEEDLIHSAQRGDTSSGLALESSPGRTNWARPVSQVVAMASQLGLDASKEAAITPRQLRQAAPKELRPVLDGIYKTFTQRGAGALKLVPAGDTRTALAFKRK